MGSHPAGEQAGERRRIVAPAGGRADAIVAAGIPSLSRAGAQRLIADGRVRFGGAPLKKSSVLQPGDELTVDLPAADAPAAPPPVDLPVLYEDDQLVVVNKPPGVVAHPSPGDASPAVSAWFGLHYPDQAATFPAGRPGIVHRLDRDTSGVLLLAKTPAAADALAAAFEHRKVVKHYLAICDGVPSRARAIIDAPVGRHPSDRSRMAVIRGQTGRHARTEYEVLGDDGRRSLLLVKPESGRTHQVRVHLAAIGAPVTFDPVYGTAGEGRQQLHAWRLRVPHPSGGFLQVTAPLAPDMAALVRSMGLGALASPYMTECPPRREFGSQ